MVQAKPTMATAAWTCALVCLCVVVGPLGASAVSILLPTRLSHVDDERATVAERGGVYGGTAANEGSGPIPSGVRSVSPSDTAKGVMEVHADKRPADNASTTTQTSTTTAVGCLGTAKCAKTPLCADCLAAVGAAAGTATASSFGAQPVVEARRKETQFARALFSTPACVWMTGQLPAANQTANGIMLQVLQETQFDAPMCTDTEGPFFGPCEANMYVAHSSYFLVSSHHIIIRSGTKRVYSWL